MGPAGDANKDSGWRRRSILEREGRERKRKARRKGETWMSGLPSGEQIRFWWQQVSAQFPRIQVDSSAMNGEPCVAGTRVSISAILGCLADGYSFQEVVKDFGNLTYDDIKEALLFAARLAWLG